MNKCHKNKLLEESQPMPESIIRSEKDHSEEAIENIESTPGIVSAAQPLIIWTPGFILCFVLALIIGLSAAGLLTEGSVNGLYTAEWPQLIYTIIAFAAWLAVSLSAYSIWVRLGAALGIVWTGFMGLHFCITLLVPHDQTYTIIAHITAAQDITLLGSYLCLSIAYTTLQRWDNWFLRLAPFAAAIGVFIIYRYASGPLQHTLRGLENSTADITLLLCCCIWWLRPSCWKIQPGPTFLLGLIPILQLFFSFPHSYTGGEPVFFTLVVLLFSGLAALRIRQHEHVRAALTTNT
jgi:hypothetical protein